MHWLGHGSPSIRICTRLTPYDGQYILYARIRIIAYSQRKTNVSCVPAAFDCRVAGARPTKKEIAVSQANPVPKNALFVCFGAMSNVGTLTDHP